MSTLRKRIDTLFDRFARWVFRNRLKVLLVMLAVVAALVSQLPKITIDTSTEGFLHERDPILVDYDQFRGQFGRDELAVLALYPNEIFDFEFLAKLKAFHEALRDEVPYVDDITSLINARDTRGRGDELVVEDLLAHWPDDAAQLAALRQRVLNDPLYRNFLVAADGSVTTVVVRSNAYARSTPEEDVLAGFEDTELQGEGAEAEGFFTDQQNTEMVEAIRQVVSRFEGQDFPVAFGGTPVVAETLKRSMRRDMGRFTVLALGCIALVLFLLFRRWSGVVFPLLVVILSLLSTLSAMAIMGVPLKMPTQILPSFLLAVGIAASVHLLALFYRHHHDHGNKEEAIAYAMGHSGLAVAMTALTTAAGLFSFAAAEVAPVADLGRFAGAGVLIALVFTLVLLPALIALTPVRQRTHASESRRHILMDQVLRRVADFSTGYPRSILLVSAAVLITAVYFASQLYFYHDPLSWLPKSEPLRQATELIDRKLKGTANTEVVVDTGQANGLYQPAVMNGLQAMHEFVDAQNQPLTPGKTLSVATILKETNQALNENRSEFYRVPQDRELIAQELLLFENAGSDDLEDFVDSQFTQARFMIRVPWSDAATLNEFVAKVSAGFEDRFAGLAEVTVTGMAPIIARTMYAAMASTTQSYIIAVVVISIMMMLLLGSVRLGLLAMIPNLLPVVMMLGIMGALDYPIDMFNMLIGSIAIGLAVDDTIHFMHNYRRYHHESADPRIAVQRTLHTTGRAMLVTSVVLSVGFFIFMAATLHNVARFGMLTGITIILALLADFLVAPALMTVIDRRRSSVPSTQEV